ncbi:hypothetical protein RUM44_003504 [Polyplax serrata]|uniref:Uncharacterized protein n=1 Tax=Polyplax serrata TaxID=468196 RepID=A0ABR1AGM7_POLSC
MSFYGIAVLVIFSSPWINAGKIAVGLSEGQMHGELQDAKARQLEETNLFKAVSQMGDMTHTMRRSLKQMRKWCRTHPTEVRLGTCLADYFNIEIPGLRRTEHLEGFKEFTLIPNLEETIKMEPHIISMLKEMSLKSRAVSELSEKAVARHNMEPIPDYYRNLTSNFYYYRDLVMENRLVICIWNYLVKKFWIWVDTAPID